MVKNSVFSSSTFFSFVSSHFFTRVSIIKCHSKKKIHVREKRTLWLLQHFIKRSDTTNTKCDTLSFRYFLQRKKECENVGDFQELKITQCFEKKNLLYQSFNEILFFIKQMRKNSFRNYHVNSRNKKISTFFKR